MKRRLKKGRVSIIKSIIDKRIFVLVLLSITTYSIFSLSNYLSQSKSNYTPVKAEDCSGTPGTSECDFGVNSCHWSCNSNPQNIPSCCERIKQTGDPYQCCFDARRVCTLDQCASIQDKKQRCGQMWENTCCPAYGSGCPFQAPPGYIPPNSVTDSPPENILKPTPVPTIIIIPSNTPFPSPTNPPATASPINLPPTATDTPPSFPPTQTPEIRIIISSEPSLRPTEKPVIEEVTETAGKFILKIKSDLMKFFSQILP